MMLNQAPIERQIDKMPPAMSDNCTPYQTSDFQRKVKAACISNRFIAAGLKIAKCIIVGNVAVGKTCLVNRYSTRPQYFISPVNNY